MSSAHQTIKLSAAFVDEARRESALQVRSIGGQVEHWARLGRAIEAAPGFTLTRVKAALAGELDPGELSEDEWALYDDLAMDDMAELSPTPASTDFYARLKNRVGSVGYDAEGRLVKRKADGTDEVLG
jgi:hypothetical protein